MSTPAPVKAPPRIPPIAFYPRPLILYLKRNWFRSLHGDCCPCGISLGAVARLVVTRIWCSGVIAVLLLLGVVAALITTDTGMPDKAALVIRIDGILGTSARPPIRW